MDTLGISNLTTYASEIANSASTNEMRKKAESASTDEELMNACKEFESYLWEQVINSMKSSISFTDESEANSQMVNYFMDTAISDVASSLTEQNMGPNSLAQQMYEQMKRNSAIDVETLLKQSAEASGISEEA